MISRVIIGGYLVAFAVLLIWSVVTDPNPALFMRFYW